MTCPHGKEGNQYCADCWAAQLERDNAKLRELSKFSRQRLAINGEGKDMSDWTREKTLKRFVIERTTQVIQDDFIFAANAKEASRAYPAAPNETARKVKVVAFKDCRDPRFVKLEGKRVLVTFRGGFDIACKQVKVWVTPFGQGTLCALNSQIHTALSHTRRWDCSWSLLGSDGRKPDPLVKDVQPL